MNSPALEDERCSSAPGLQHNPQQFLGDQPLQEFQRCTEPTSEPLGSSVADYFLCPFLLSGGHIPPCHPDLPGLLLLGWC